MKGAIIGDIVGSVYEFAAIKTKNFPLFTDASSFTDDSIMTIAVADALMHNLSFTAAFKKYGQLFPDPMGGYGGRFGAWLTSESNAPYNSFGNGSAMRVSPVGFFFNTEAKVLAEAARSSAATHNHPEGIKGAEATALAIFLSRTGKTKSEIRQRITAEFGYNLNFTIDSIRASYRFDETAQNTVPQAIVAFLDSTDFEDALRNAVSLGGDADTLACITGGIAEAFYKIIPPLMLAEYEARLPDDLKQIVAEFETHIQPI
jgi:ADP-ribosylglycohydrolase